jgi:UDP-glucose 4-epimerase
MKKILVTGKNSYVGTSVENWLLKSSDNYKIDTIDMEDSSWIEYDFSKYDAVFHVAGIAHVSSDPEKKELYYRVNRDLTIETAKKAKNEGVKQFIFMSSIIVYGASSQINKERIIHELTKPEPHDFYGDSKLQAEKGLEPLRDDNFKVVILRPPMIYGKDSKGNYPKLAKLARYTPIFPDIDNKRSMLHIDNLSEFVRLMIENEEDGLFFPQNKEYVNTKNLVKEIASVYNHKIIFTKLFNKILFLMSKKVNLINKVFGDLVYKKEMSEYKEDYWVRDFKESIQITEVKD